jgi:hypothetical protein
LSLQNNGRRVEIVYGEDGLISELKIIWKKLYISFGWM